MKINAMMEANPSERSNRPRLSITALGKLLKCRFSRLEHQGNINPITLQNQRAGGHRLSKTKSRLSCFQSTSPIGTHFFAAFQDKKYKSINLSIFLSTQTKRILFAICNKYGAV